MTQVKSGDTVRVHYTGRLESEEVFDSSQGREPLEFTLGEGRVIKGFETAVLGMAVGEERTVTIPSADAYGPRRDEMVATLSRDQVPPGVDPQVGQRLQLSQGEQLIPVTVTSVSDETVTLDANHPLAGRDLTFDLELVEIV